MNKIGFNVLAWSAGVSEDLFPIIERLKNIGYDGVEYFVGSDDENAYKKLGKHSKELGLEVTTVTVVNPETNPISSEAKIRAKGLDKIKWAIDRNYDLGSHLLCGPIHSAHAHFVGHEALEEEYKWGAEIMQDAGEYAKQADVVLGLEALNRFESYLCNTMEQLAKLVKMSNHSHVKAMFDTHHANIEEKKYLSAIQTIAPHLSHVHISENDRGTPGDGHIPFDDAFSALKSINYDKWLTIEAFSRNDVAFANAIGVWREYNEPWHIAENGFKFIQEMCKKHGL